ncbi:MAG TPA: response regulator [Planctomycetota bacterium]|nr:response regulator [Planctomycetota bacterium]
MSVKAATVLLASRQLDQLYELRSRLESGGVQVVTAGTTSEALDRLREESPHLVVLDQDLDPESAASLILTMRHCSPPPEIVLLTPDEPENEEYVRRSLGLLYYGMKPADAGFLFGRIRESLKDRRLAFSAPAKEAPLVLCVDDDALQLSALSRVLTKHGYRVRTCESGLRALSSLLELRPDVAIVDIMMPGSSGLELVERLNRRSGGRIPVVMLTALNTPASHQAAKERGVQHYLTKPCADGEVLAAIESSLAAADR